MIGIMSKCANASHRPPSNGQTPAKCVAVATPGRPASAATADAVLPQLQVGTTPQRLVMTLLGDEWTGHTELIPTTALAQLLAEFDITESSARSALSRLTERGLLVSTKRGRNTYYGLSSRAVPLIEETLRRVLSFGTEETRTWDGEWTMVAFSVPESQRRLRHSIRTSLRQLGFAALFDGLWCSPWSEQEATLEILARLGIESATVMRSKVDARSVTQPPSGWDLDTLREKYVEFEARFAPIRNDVRRGGFAVSEALVVRTSVLDNWRSFLGEPDLPAELLPADWPRARLRELFLELYEGLAEAARYRCQQIVADHAPDIADLMTHHASGTTVARPR